MVVSTPSGLHGCRKRMVPDMENCPKCEGSVTADMNVCPACGEILKPEKIKLKRDAASMLTLGGLETVDETTYSNVRSSDNRILEAGTVFADRYSIKDVVGHGGMGVVYKAEDTLTKKEIALKLIRPERLAGTHAIEKLIAEGITTRDIRHPNVIAVYDVGQSAGQPFVSMEYLDGQPLRHFILEHFQNREAVPLRIAARIICEVLDGLSAAHKLGVVHRDLKPENIMLLGKPTEKSAPLKILDFGIARSVKPQTVSGTTAGLGTPDYMAPEQRNNPDLADEDADLYSLSVLFYELLTNSRPNLHWQPPSDGRPEVPQSIDRLIKSGLSNNRKNRPQSTSEYREAVVKAVNIGGYKSKNKKQPKRLKQPVRSKQPSQNNSHIWLWAGGIAAALSVVALISVIPITDTKDPCDPLAGGAYNACASRIAGLNGTWYDSAGANYDMGV